MSNKLRKVTWIEQYKCEGVFEGPMKELKHKAYRGALRAQGKSRMRNLRVEVKRVAAKEET